MVADPRKRRRWIAYAARREAMREIAVAPIEMTRVFQSYLGKSVSVRR